MTERMFEISLRWAKVMILIILEVWQLLENRARYLGTSVCQVYLARFYRISQSTSCGSSEKTCQSWLSKLYFIIFLRIHIFYGSIVQLPPAYGCLVGNKSKNTVLLRYTWRSQIVQWKKSCFMKIGSYQSKKFLSITGQTA